MLSSKDIADIEKKYSKYIFKKRLKLFILVIFLLTVTIFALFFIFYNSDTQINIIDLNKTTKDKIEKINSTIQQKKINFRKTGKLENDNNLTEAINIIKPKKNIEPDTNDTNISIVNNNIEKKLIFHIKPSSIAATNVSSTGILRLNSYFLNKESNTLKQKNKNTVKNIHKNDTILKEKDVKTKIHIEMKDIDSIQYLKNKFQKTHDIVFALMLCENYYSQKNYRESLKWSIISNDIDNQSERSWMWFAKSKYKLNKKKDAIKALRAFLKSNESKSIKLLLRDIVNGELND